MRCVSLHGIYLSFNNEKDRRCLTISGKKSLMLPFETFKTIIKHTPLISIDLIVSDQEGRVLLGKRNNRPAQGYWFVPGGRILKDESMLDAFKRLTLNELGVEFDFEKAELIGPFEHFYKDNVSVEDFSTHYIALGYRLMVDENLLVLPKEQHNQYKWMSEDELLNDSHVHKHSRWYFDSSAI
jgi:colanic acid biosynthesis protein WcaH